MYASGVLQLNAACVLLKGDCVWFVVAGFYMHSYSHQAQAKTETGATKTRGGATD